MSTQSFSCDDCNQYPAEDFSILHLAGTVTDWMIAYPERSLIHVHYGVPTQQEQDNLAEAQFVYDFFMQTVQRFPGQNFFVIVDMSKVDNSEFVPPAALKLYRKILQHPQLRVGAVYGGTRSFNFLVDLLLKVTGASVSVVATLSEANQLYQNWKKV